MARALGLVAAGVVVADPCREVGGVRRPSAFWSAGQELMTAMTAFCDRIARGIGHLDSVRALGVQVRLMVRVSVVVPVNRRCRPWGAVEVPLIGVGQRC